ncbi:MAG: lamin tail domain-containing protein, partial [Pyrinomonadaceae bacterium]
MHIVTWLRLAALILFIIAAQKITPVADEVTVAGYTNGCFCTVPPDTAELQMDGSYTNSVFSGTTSINFLGFGAGPATPPARNVNNLGSFAPSNDGGGFTLRVTFTEPQGIIGSNSVLIPAQIGGPFIDFDNTPRTFNFTHLNADGSRTSGSFAFTVNDLARDGHLESLTGYITGIQSTLPKLLINEFRVRGPNGANDEFVEIYNATGAAHTVQTSDGSSGYSVAASSGGIRFTIPNGTVIPAGGHYLGVNSVGYSLASYPAGNGTTATGDATYTTDIPDNAGIALFNTATVANFTLANRLDAVGSTSEANTLYKEGTGYPALTPFSIDYSFYRSNCPNSGGMPLGCLSTDAGRPKDSDNNSADFVFVDTNGTSAGAGQRLGAPGPENLSSPVQKLLGVTKLDPA